MPFSAQGLRAKPMPAVGGVELGSREPVFDIVVSAAKKSTFSRLSQNETAKECYKLGFFDPANADAALAALEMMDFEGVERCAPGCGRTARWRSSWCSCRGRWQDCLPLLRSSPAAPKRRRTLPV